MSKEILAVVEIMSNEKGVEEEVIFDAIETALAMATIKGNDDKMDVRVSIDRDTGSYQTFRRWLVIEDDTYIEGEPGLYIRLSDAIEQDPNILVDEYIEEEIESIEFGRIAAQTAKQVIIQKVREAERKKVVEEYSSRVGEILTGIVKRVDRGDVILDMGDNVDAIIPRSGLINRETFKIGDRVRAHLHTVEFRPRGAQLFMSRSSKEMLAGLFKIEVPEIGDDLIDIMSVARDVGFRAKIAVRANDPRLDPIGACVGMRGGRVTAVTNELNGERIDIIQWDPNDAQYVINAMAPAEITSIMVDEDRHEMDLAVEDEQLSLAIGKGGQNIRLASELTGWELNVMSKTEMEEKHQSESARSIEMFKALLEADDELATVLVEEGFTSLEEIAYVPTSEMLEIDGFDEELVGELKQRAKDALLTQALVLEEHAALAQPADDLLALEGMTPELAKELAIKDVITQEDLAELGVEEMLELVNISEQEASDLIIKARAPWFE